ncbi:MAG: transcription antitermination factor NusB [Acutalibacteraceae bacterium]|jgi:N utilization substance protein B
MTRRQAREQAFIVLFEKSFHPETALDEILEVGVEQELVQEDEYASNLAQTAWDNLVSIDDLIEQNSIGWRINRISKVALAILRLSVCEILYLPDVPVSVSINEAVELGKKFGAEEDSAFINGVLGSIARLDEEEQKNAPDDQETQ